MIRSTSIALCLVLCQAIPLTTNEDGTIQAMDKGVASIGNKNGHRLSHLHHPNYKKQEPTDLVDKGKWLAGKEQADKCRAQQAEMAKASNEENTKLFETKSSELKAGDMLPLADYLKGSQKMKYSDEVMKAIASNMTKNMRLEASPPDYENGPESKRESVAKTFTMNGIVEMMTDEEIAEVKERHAMWHPGGDQSSIALVLADNYLYDGHNMKAMQLLSAGIRKTKKPNVKSGKKLKQRIKDEDKEFARDVMSATKDAGYEMVKQAVTDWKDSLMPEFPGMPTLYDFQAKVDSLNCPSQWCSATCGAYDSLNNYIDGDIMTTWERVDDDLQSLADMVAGAIDICDAVDTVYTLASVSKPAAFALSQVPEPTVKTLFTNVHTVVALFVRIVGPFNKLLGRFKTQFLEPIATGIEKAQAGSEKSAEMLELVRQTFKSYLYDPVKVADNICQHATKEVCTASVTNAIRTAESKLREAHGATETILNTLTTVIAALDPFRILLAIPGMEDFLEAMMKVRDEIDPIYVFMDWKFCISFPTTISIGTSEVCTPGKRKANLLAAGDDTAAHTHDVTLLLPSGPSMMTSTQQEERARRIAVAKLTNSGLITGNKFDRHPANITDRALLAALDMDPTLDVACLGIDLPLKLQSEATKTKLWGHGHWPVHAHVPHVHIPPVPHVHVPHVHIPPICVTVPDPTKITWGGHHQICTMTIREAMGHFADELFRQWACFTIPALHLVPRWPDDYQGQIIFGMRDKVAEFILDKMFNNVLNAWVSEILGFDINRFANMITSVPAVPSLFNGISLPNVNLGNWLPGFNIPSNILNPIGYPSWAGFSAPRNWVSDLTIQLPGVNFKPNLPSINTGCWSQCTTYTLTMITTTWAYEISWSIDNTINNDPSSYSNHGTYTQSVCLNSGRHKLECKDSYGDGWHGGYITINGNTNNLCSDFTNGKDKSVWFTV